ncbi:MAG: SIS domain-containing protein, partial [Clostridiaceae bacterium]|nr:SIS domain-containing protein [Clostridiaceae bacterium]
GLKIYLLGAGSSGEAASIVANYIKKVTKKEVISITSTTFITQPDSYICDNSPVRSSGDTMEGLQSIKIFEERDIEPYQILIICSEEGKIIKSYSSSKNVLYIPIPKGTKGKSIAATGEFTLLIQYALMIFDIKNFQYYKEMFSNIIEDSNYFFKEDIYKSHAISNKEYDTIVSLGSNSLIWLASEMCLKINEHSMGMQSATFHSILEFRHGPKMIMNSKSLISFFFSNNYKTVRYELDMLRECYNDKKNGTIVAISMNYNKEIDENSDYYFYFNKNDFSYMDDSHCVFQYSLYLQTIAILKSIDLSFSPDLIDNSGFINKVAQGVILYS